MDKNPFKTHHEHRIRIEKRGEYYTVVCMDCDEELIDDEVFEKLYPPKVVYTWKKEAM